MNDIDNDFKTKTIAQKLYLKVQENHFEDFKYNLNKVYAAFKNKDFLNFNYERAQEKRKQQLEDYYYKLLNFSDFLTKKIISDIYYSLSVEEAYNYIEQYNYVDEDLLKTSILSIKKFCDELEKLKEKITYQKKIINSLNEKKTQELLLIIDSYYKKNIIFKNSLILLELIFSKDIDEIQLTEDNYEYQELKIEGEDEKLKNQIETFSDEDIKVIINKKNELLSNPKLFEFDDADIEIDIKDILSMLEN